MGSVESHEMTTAASVPRELAGAEFGDARLSARLLQVAEACAAMPDQSLPKATQSKPALDAAYRFFSNEAVSMQAILQPHQEQTVQRIAAERVAVAVWDTTQLAFGGAREGLGRLNGNNDQGFLLHVGLAVSADGHRRPLGVLGAYPWVRTGSARSKKPGGVNRSGAEYARDKDKESARWGNEMLAADQLVGERARLIHIADREADAFELLRKLVEDQHRFVIRVHYDRTTLDGEEPEKVSAACERAPVLVSREVALARRVAKPMPGTSKTLAPREARVARLAVRATRVALRKPRYVRGAETLALHVVYVSEIDPPADVEPVDWRLYTTELMDTTEQVLQIVDFYRARWVIEEFFKALKTGCQFEKLQLESYDALTNALGLYLTIAWSILLLRALARTQPDAPAQVALSDTQIQVLRAMGKLKPPRPTVAEAMLAVAQLGGYIKHKIGPGWLVLARGMQDLLMLERGWLARKALEDVQDP